MIALPRGHLKGPLEERFQVSFNLQLLGRYQKRLQQQLHHWQQNYQSRNALAKLDNARLSDIGVTPEQAKQESNKPFWR
ncbi:DUF1127 domain-containing protein [Neptuniibacter pectenicola]|mgnify:FL=1|jgi:uncharacterized protein YjiS (DUF1127 family)|uniref:DUF1127 domain-containing protein n=1 Tax=Neptuniibacter pectenicola TaxID=1806669 RepID=UPI00079BC5D0|nr:DUF1127 domain-containing protein [Neptuniibacter pectenicola]KXJ53992.1 MAG: hypothetical protein AXW15_02625 [Neptuniibacter sp. Phe_28]|tara:strand:+ start:4446 stop:4682 length:237 start_codon:yes stop_codon:yes gene_type:complete